MTQEALPLGWSVIPEAGTNRQHVIRDTLIVGTLTPDPEGLWVECSILPGARGVETVREGVFYLLGMLQASLVLTEQTTSGR
ncbi:hypothetical protein [Kitasatospora indigofera]|uniref:hypothetical protein n=1 Tax=Kitasatospora indigofera TaxID=67307 RepID=UPI0033A49167